MRRILAFVLLAILGLSLSAGAHPCEARTEAPAAAVATQPPCHAMAPMAPKTAPDHPTASQKGTPQGCGSDDADHPCTHICHVMAVVTATPVAFAVEPVALMSASAPVRTLQLLARSIDHIPLA